MNLFEPLEFSRKKFIRPDQAARVHEMAKEILAKIGIEILNEAVLGQIKKMGLHCIGSRVLFEPVVVEEYLSDMRRRIAIQSKPVPENDHLKLYVNSYSMFVHDPDTDQVVKYDTPRLIEMTKLMDSLAGDGVLNAPPGFPMDEPPDLQSIAQYRIATLYARQGATPVDPTSVRTVDYLLEMAEVMGEPVSHLYVWVPSPLRLGGESLDVVLACQDRLSSISVGSMPCAGATAPLQPFGALALASAELIGAMIVVQMVTGKPTSFQVPLLPFDLHAGAMVFGSPELFLYSMLSSDMNCFYGHPWNPAPASIMTMAKRPDQQAAAEKAGIMISGALLGARSFYWGGTLSLDEIFSPIQLLMDCEIRDWVQQAVRGIWLGEEAVENWLSEIEAGLKQGFMALDSTLDYHKLYTWYPKRSERGTIGGWIDRGQPHLEDRLRAEVKQRIASHDFELDTTRRKAVDKIYASARHKIMD
jgi:trimethylamine--corrinoid protein Co-methyltransferase